MRAILNFASALFVTNLRATLALRGAFWFAAVMMLLNNLLYFSIWWIFFDRFDEIRGWRFGDMAALFGVVAAGFGCAVVFAGGVRDLGRYIIDGELDGFLTQPKPPLLHALGSQSRASGWGDIASGLFLIGISGVVRPASAPLVLVAVASSAAVFTATGVILHSSAFWLGRTDSLARQFWEFQIAFSSYPRVIFGGVLKVLLFTVIPAGFIGFLPAELLRDFTWLGLAAVLGGASAYVLLAFAVFGRGLRSYESGNRVGLRA